MGPMNEVKYFFGKEADAVIAGESAFHKTCPINPTPTPGTPGTVRETVGGIWPDTPGRPGEEGRVS